MSDPDPGMEAGWTDEIPWRGRDVIWAALAGIGFAICFIVVVIVPIALSGASPSNATLAILVFVPFDCGLLLGACLLIVRRRGISLRDIGFIPVSWKTIALMVPAYIAMLLLAGIVIVITSPLVGEPPPTDQQLAIDKVSIAPVEGILLFLAVAVLGPFVEELFFRGLVYRYLRKRWTVVSAIVSSSVLFALLHFYISVLPAIFVIGVVLAIVAERYRSLYPSFALHALTNAVAILGAILS